MSLSTKQTKKVAMHLLEKLYWSQSGYLTQLIPLSTSCQAAFRQDAT